MGGWLTNKRQGFWNWTIALALILGGGVISGFVLDGRSLVDEWSLLATQLFVTSVFALPAGFLVSRLAKGCIVCREETTETDE